MFKDGPHTHTVVTTQHISRQWDRAESVPCKEVLERTLATSNALNKKQKSVKNAAKMCSFYRQSNCSRVSDDEQQLCVRVRVRVSESH